MPTDFRLAAQSVALVVKVYAEKAALGASKVSSHSLKARLIAYFGAHDHPFRLLDHLFRQRDHSFRDRDH